MIVSKFFCRGALLISTLVFFVVSIPLTSFAKEEIVGVEKTILRNRPSHLGKKLGVVVYGEIGRVLKERKSWLLIQFTKGKGWLHKSALGSKDSVLTDIGRGEEVAKNSYRDEVVSAGKGFSPEFEQMYKKQNSGLNFQQVDEVESFEVSADFIEQFQRKGGLRSRVLRRIK